MLLFQHELGTILHEPQPIFSNIGMILMHIQISVGFHYLPVRISKLDFLLTAKAKFRILRPRQNRRTKAVNVMLLVLVFIVLKLCFIRESFFEAILWARFCYDGLWRTSIPSIYHCTL